MTERVSSGINGLDKLVNGGFPNKTVILLSGNPGTGKTLFALNYLLDGARKKEKCYYLSFGEKSEELVRACEGVESLREAKDFLGNNFQIGHLKLGSKLSLSGFEEILKLYPKLNRIVIDNVNKMFISAIDKKDYRLRLASIVELLKEKADSAILIGETSNGIFDTGNGEAFECDGVIHLSFLDFGEKPLRVLSIPKMRYTNFDPLVKHSVVIDSKSIRMGKTKAV